MFLRPAMSTIRPNGEAAQGGSYYRVSKISKLNPHTWVCLLWLAELLTLVSSNMFLAGP